MEDHETLRGLIDTGKGNLQWERDIPPAALANLVDLATKDFKGNLGTIIHDIYQTAHVMFGDMPQGDHKKRAKYRFASKTLMRILPSSLKGEVEGLIESEKMTLDLYEKFPCEVVSFFKLIVHFKPEHTILLIIIVIY